MILGDFTRKASDSFPFSICKHVLQCCRGLSVNMKVLRVWRGEIAVNSTPWKWPRMIAISIRMHVPREWTPGKMHAECTLTHDASGVHHVATAFFLILGEESVTRCGQELSPYGANFCLILWPLLRCRFPDAGACFFSDPSCASPHVGGCFFFAQKSICLPPLHTASPYSFH